MVRRAVGSDVFRLKFGQYNVTGTPVLEEAAAAKVDGALTVSTLGALAGVAVLLALAFAVRRRLAPVVCAAAAVAVALGLAAVAGIRMTAVTAPAAPIVAGIGAGVAVRLQAAVGGTRGRPFSHHLPCRNWSQPCAPRGRASGWLPWRPAWPS